LFDYFVTVAPPGGFFTFMKMLPNMPSIIKVIRPVLPFRGYQPTFQSWLNFFENFGKNSTSNVIRPQQPQTAPSDNLKKMSLDSPVSPKVAKNSIGCSWGVTLGNVH
jgi:hypothetical protein